MRDNISENDELLVSNSLNKIQTGNRAVYVPVLVESQPRYKQMIQSKYKKVQKSLAISRQWKEQEQEHNLAIREALKQKLSEQTELATEMRNSIAASGVTSMRNLQQLNIDKVRPNTLTAELFIEIIEEDQ
jgi:hypothetical protein